MASLPIFALRDAAQHTARHAGRAIVAALALGLVHAGPAAAPAENAATADVGRPFEFDRREAKRRRFMEVRLLGALELVPAEVDGLRARELSALAWDADEDVLYALSDGGLVAHFRPRFAAGRLTGARLLRVCPLTDANGRALPPALADAEALSLRGAADGEAGNTELLVAFERRPRIARYDSCGRWRGDLPLPAPFGDAAAYVHDNKALEGLAELPGIGLIAAPERPLGGDTSGTVPLFALDGRRWPYRLHDAAHGAVVALEPTPAGALLVLERRFVSVLRPLRITLAEVRPAPLAPGTAPAVRTLARFSTADGWALDNFEGLAHHAGGRYFMVSDDNRSALQKTLLVYLEILPPQAASATR